MNTGQVINTAVCGGFAIIFIVCYILIMIKFIKSRTAKLKRTDAVVVDKYKKETFSQRYGALKRDRYVVVFMTENKKLSFDVSEFSYGEYKINERGTLTYRGDKLYSFK